MASWIRESEIFTSADTSGDHTSRSRRVADLIGLACLVAAFVLLSSGVRLARADDKSEANMSVDPALAAELEAAKAERPRAIARPDGPAIQPGIRPGVAGVEIAPGVVRLNTRGYNYRSAAGGVDVPPAVPSPGVQAPVPAAPSPSDAPADPGN